MRLVSRIPAIVYFAALACRIFGQNLSSFEVADVKLNQSRDAGMTIDFQPGGRFSAHNVPMKILIALAYHLRPEMVTAGPKWLGTARYDIIAKGVQTSSSDDLRRMMQSLLAERFKLIVHNEERLMPAYALVRTAKGPKMHPSEESLASEQRCVPGDGEPGQKHFVCRHLTTPLLADTLQEIAARDLDVTVRDRTGLKGAFDLKLDWVPSGPNSDNPSVGPTLFDAIENQLGLRLERTKISLPVIAVDNMEQIPLEN